MFVKGKVDQIEFMMCGRMAAEIRSVHGGKRRVTCVDHDSREVLLRVTRVATFTGVRGWEIVYM